MHPASPMLMALLGVAALIFIVVAGINLYGEGKITSAGSWMPARFVAAEVVESSAAVEFADVQPATLEECVDAGYVGIGVDPSVSDVRTDFLEKFAKTDKNAARLIAETWCASFMDAPRIDETRDYSVRKLIEWSRAINALNERDGLGVRSYISSLEGPSTNRIRYHVMTEFDRTLQRAAAGSLDIPLYALEIEVLENAELDDPPVRLSTDYGIQVGWDFSDPGLSEGPATFGVILENHGDELVKLNHGTDSTTELLIFTQDGRQVFRSGWPLIAEGGRESLIGPGKSVRFERKWAHVNDDGFVVPAGEYLFRVCVRFGLDRELTGGVYVSEELCSAASELHQDGDDQ